MLEFIIVGCVAVICALIYLLHKNDQKTIADRIELVQLRNELNYANRCVNSLEDDIKEYQDELVEARHGLTGLGTKVIAYQEELTILRNSLKKRDPISPDLFTHDELISIRNKMHPDRNGGNFTELSAKLNSIIKRKAA